MNGAALQKYCLFIQILVENHFLIFPQNVEVILICVKF